MPRQPKGYAAPRGILLDFSHAWRFILPKFSNDQRPKPAVELAGMLIYNTTTQRLEFCDGSTWRILPAGT